MNIKRNGRDLILIKKPASFMSRDRVPQPAILSEDGTRYELIRQNKGPITIGVKCVKVISCGITYQ
jgi:hypothetical protein